MFGNLMARFHFQVGNFWKQSKISAKLTSSVLMVGHRDRNIKTLECTLLLFDQYEADAPPAPFC